MEVPEKVFMITFEIFLLYRDRPNLVQNQINALKSLKIPEWLDLKLIISDNSETLNTITDTSDFEVRYRGNLSVQDHVNVCIEEATASRFMFIHDDDVIHSDIFEITENLLLNNELVNYTIAGGANIIDENGITVGTFGSEEPQMIPSLELFLKAMFTGSNYNYPAFPVYIYSQNSKHLMHVDFEKGGRFADVSLLMELYTRNLVLWTSEKYYNYRIHGANDGHVVDLSGRYSLLKHLLNYEYSKFLKIIICFNYLKNMILLYLKEKFL